MSKSAAPTGSEPTFGEGNTEGKSGAGAMPSAARVCRESLCSFAMIAVIIAVGAVQLVVVHRIKKTAVETQTDLIAADARRAIVTFFDSKTAVVEDHEFLFRTGQFNARSMVVHPKYAEVDAVTRTPNPIELQQYEAMTVPFFRKDSDLVALYMAMSNNQTWKVHREKEDQITTQLRYAGTVSATNSTPYYERYERQRSLDDLFENFVLGGFKEKEYTPTEQGWYQDASNTSLYDSASGKYRGIWQGPSFQGTGKGADGHGYGMDPVVTYLLKVVWADGTNFSVFKLKILTKNINSMLQQLNIPAKGDIAVVNPEGEIAAYREAAAQIIPDAKEPENPKLAKFSKIWTIDKFSGVTLDEVAAPLTGFKMLGDGVTIFGIDEAIPGWRIVIYLDGNVLIQAYRALLNTVLALAVVLIVLSFLSIIYTTYRLRQQTVSGSQ